MKLLKEWEGDRRQLREMFRLLSAHLQAPETPLAEASCTRWDCSVGMERQGIASSLLSQRKGEDWVQGQTDPETAKPSEESCAVAILERTPTFF